MGVSLVGGPAMRQVEVRALRDRGHCPRLQGGRRSVSGSRGWLGSVGGAFGFQLFFPAGEEPEDVGKAVEEADDFRVGDGLFGAVEVDEGAFGSAGDGAGHVGMGS
jgi:hypothetical protein